jgi:hypothetical protein
MSPSRVMCMVNGVGMFCYGIGERDWGLSLGFLVLGICSFLIGVLRLDR